MKSIVCPRRLCYVKRAGMLLIVAALIAGMAGCDWASPPEEREIWDWNDLHAVRFSLNDNYHLMNDLDATTAGYEELAGPTANGGRGWQPIGTCIGPDIRVFEGRFDGQGHEIRDLFINRPDENCVGLFGAVDGSKQVGSGVVANVGVVNATVTGGSSVGAVVGYLTLTWLIRPGTVSNCYATGNVAGNLSVGGLVGLNLGVVSSCYSAAGVTGHDRVGGLVGRNAGTVSDSYCSGNVTGYTNVGGLIGLNDETVSNCYSSAWVTGEQSVGGLVGANRSEYKQGIVSDSFWDIETSGQTISAGGTGKTTAEMQNIATFIDAETEGLDEPWDICAVADPNERNSAYTWNIIDGEAYPFLSWESVAW